MSNKIDNKKKNFLFSSNYFTITKLPRFFLCPDWKIFLLLAQTLLVGILPHLYGVSNSEQSMGRWSPKTAEEEQSYLPMLLFYLLLNYKEYWHVRKEEFCLSAGNQYKQRISQGFSVLSLEVTSPNDRSGYHLGGCCVLSPKQRWKNHLFLTFFLSILKRLKGHISLQEYREEGRILQ